MAIWWSWVSCDRGVGCMVVMWWPWVSCEGGVVAVGEL